MVEDNPEDYLGEAKRQVGKYESSATKLLIFDEKSASTKHVLSKMHDSLLFELISHPFELVAIVYDERNCYLLDTCNIPTDS